MEFRPYPKKKRKYQRGTNPCGNCNSGQHRNCRPKLDGTLCSCSCERATDMREEYMLQVELSRERGEQIPTIEQVAQQIKPKYQKLF